MEYGIFVGVNRKSNEFLVATVERIKKARTIKRIPKEERWSEGSSGLHGKSMREMRRLMERSQRE
eukprot:1309779-Karenia_brevis.AAC.1